MIDKDGFLYTIMGAGTLLKYTDDNKFDASLRLVKQVDLRDSLPKDVAKDVSRIGAIGMTYDGHLAVVATGVITVVDRDLKLVDMIPIPGEAVDNNIAIDETEVFRVRQGEPAEAAHFAASLLDGKNLYQAGNFFPVSGG